MLLTARTFTTAGAAAGQATQQRGVGAADQEIARRLHGATGHDAAAHDPPLAMAVPMVRR